MNNRILLLSLAASFFSFAAVASPAVSDVVLSQAHSRLVTVTYSLSDDAIVTFEAFTNGVSIGLAPLANAAGDVNVKVTAGTNRRITWDPLVAWSGRKILGAGFSVAVTAWALDNAPDYLIVNLRQKNDLKWYVSAEAVPNGITNDIYKTEKLALRRIHASGVRWQMGCSSDESDTSTYQAYPRHDVILTNDYYMGVYKVTAFQHNAIGGTFSGGMTPRQSPTYSGVRGANATYDWPTKGHAVDPNSICGKLDAHTGLVFDLPTDAQWEFAMRAGTTGCYCGAASVGDIAWCNDTSVVWTRPGATGKKGVQKVGLLAPNAWGIYDPIGNGFELCLDWYDGSYGGVKMGDLVIEPVGPVSGTTRLLHSGSWDHNSGYSRVHYRNTGLGDSDTTSYCTYRVTCGADFH